MVRYLFYTIGDLTYQSPFVDWVSCALRAIRKNASAEGAAEEASLPFYWFNVRCTSSLTFAARDS